LPGLRLEPAARRRAQIEVRLRCAHLIHAIVLQRGGPYRSLLCPAGGALGLTNRSKNRLSNYRARASPGAEKEHGGT
jgi:hypothetical protein